MQVEGIEHTIGRTIEHINIGDTATFSKTLTEADVYQFSGMTGNFNPTHVNKEFAAKTPNGRRTVPQMLVAGLVSKILGTEYPGNGTVHVAQDLTYHRPVFIDDTVQARLVVTCVDGRRSRVWLDLTCTNQDGETVVTGESEIIPPEIYGEGEQT